MERRIPAGDGADLWVVDDGTTGPPTVVCCHGGPGVADDLEPVAAMMSGRARVVRWDQRGAGRSTRRGPFTIARFVDDLERVRDSYGTERCVLVGHSWGANLVIHYAQAHPHRVLAVAYLCGTGLEWWPAFSGGHKRAQAARLGPARWERLSDLRGRQRTEEEDREFRLLYLCTEFSDPQRAAALAERVLAIDDRFGINDEANAAINAESKALDLAVERSRCRVIAAPVLVVQGADDPRPLSAVDSLVAALPNVERAVIAGTGHFPWMERPDELHGLLNGLLDQVQEP